MKLSPNYLQRLTIQLSAGVGNLPESFRRKHADYLAGAQRADGGFAGREGESDLYYTGFALRGLAILGELQGEVAQRAAEFLTSKLQARETIIDFLSLIYGGMLLDSAAGINIFAAAPGGWHKPRWLAGDCRVLPRPPDVPSPWLGRAGGEPRR